MIVAILFVVLLIAAAGVALVVLSACVLAGRADRAIERNRCE